MIGEGKTYSHPASFGIEYLDAAACGDKRERSVAAFHQSHRRAQSPDLRHSFASFLVNEGVSLYVVQALLGHANARTTQRYAHLASDTLTDATEIVDGIVAAQPRAVTPAAVEEMASW